MDAADDIDASLQEDHYDEDDWSDDYQDEENRPPRSKLSNIKNTDLAPITEESRLNYSRYTVHNDDKESGDITQKTQAPTPVIRDGSISFDDDKKSFGKIDDIAEELKKQEEDCHQRNFLRPPADVSRDYEKQRSWEPTQTSLNLTKCSMTENSLPPRSRPLQEVPQSSVNISVASNAGKYPVTSTPISGRSAPQFHTNISRISERNMSKQSVNMSRNQTDCSLSETKLNKLIKNIDCDQSSVEIARKFVNQNPIQSNLSRRVPKQSVLLDNLKANSQPNRSVKPSASTKVQPKPKSYIPKLTTVSERDSFTSQSRPSTTNFAEIAVKPEPLSHWGFVAIGETVQSKVYVRNQSSETLEVSPFISNDGPFRLISNDSVHIQPDCIHEFCITFTPTSRSRFRHKVDFTVTSSGNRYSHTLFGYGGTANVKVLPQQSCMSFFPREGIYRCTPTDPSHFTFDVENAGDRTAFVHIVPLDESGVENKSIAVEPESFALPNSEKNKITVKMPENYVQDFGRMSLASSTSTSTITKNRILTLKVYFGDERLRRRATTFSMAHNSHQIYKGLLLTKTPFLWNGHEFEVNNDKDPVTIQDVELLKAQTHVLTVIVGSDRVGILGTLSLPQSRPNSAYSHRIFDDGFYAPECNKEGDLTTVSVANIDRTIMK